MRSVEEIAILTVALGFIILGGITGNVLVLMVLKRQPNRHKPSSMLLMNLALSDLCLASVVQPYQLATVINTNLIENNGVLCHIGGVVSYPFFIVSMGTLMGMCVDRFYALGNPLLYRVRITFNVALGMVIYPWVHAVAFGLGAGLGIDVEYDPDTMDCGLGWKKRHIAFAVFVCVTHVMAPLTTLLVSNALLFSRLKSHDRKLCKLEMQSRANWHKIQGRNTEELRRSRHSRGFEKKVSLMVNSILSIFLMCWTPYLLTRLLNAVGVILPSFVQTGSVWILHANSMINPILYTNFRRDLKSAIKELFNCKKNRLATIT